MKLLMETSILLPSMISICFLMLLMNQDSHRTAAQMLGISQPAAHIPFEYRSDTVVHIISICFVYIRAALQLIVDSVMFSLYLL